MNWEQVKDIAWKAICKTYKAVLEHKMCNDEYMDKMEIDIYHMTLKELIKSENNIVISYVNKFDIYDVWK